MCGFVTAGQCMNNPGIADPSTAACHPSGMMQCTLRSGSISCPILWIASGSTTGEIYEQGCCGDSQFAGGPSGPYCGVAASGGLCTPASLLTYSLTPAQ
jgi:hypothetical protein